MSPLGFWKQERLRIVLYSQKTKKIAKIQNRHICDRPMIGVAPSNCHWQQNDDDDGDDDDEDYDDDGGGGGQHHFLVILRWQQGWRGHFRAFFLSEFWFSFLPVVALFLILNVLVNPGDF